MFNKFIYRSRPSNPGDFVSFPAVWADGYKESSVVRDGDVVTDLGEVKISTETDWDDAGPTSIELEYRKIRIDKTGFVGWVSWWAHDTYGFMPLDQW